MRGFELARLALIVGTMSAVGNPLPGQTGPRTFGALGLGLTAKPDYGLSRTGGLAASATVGRWISGRAALRLEAEFQSFGVKRQGRIVTDCFQPGSCASILPMPAAAGNGPVRIAALLASVQWFEQGDRQGFYLVGGLGPQVLVAHPDRPRAARLAVQVGAGVAVSIRRAAMFLEVRYERRLGTGAEPARVVPVYAGLRL
jgi:hypothetical protein